MKPFIQIAQPHKDIIEGRLTMDVFAADLWKVFKKQAPDEYIDSDIFFKKTYLTKGLENLIKVAEKRLKGNGIDPVIQLQTPFGGGKTHSLIALYHKAKKWKANVVVIDGTVLNAEEVRIWEEIEKQLTGKIELLKGNTSPGREKLEKILIKKQPLLLLIDEILEYITKAGGVIVGSSNLASQTLAFIQELTESISGLEKSMMVLTLPSSVLEHYDETAEKAFQQLQKISGRIEKVYTPVEDEEIAEVVKKRLFNSIDEKGAKENIEEFLDYAEKENILTEDRAIYRDKFIKSFPFQPEVIDVLYKRWGSFPSFQRTRGVLRILGLVVYSLKDKQIPFIRVSDFDLENEEIRRELVKHIGNEYDSIIASDITSSNSGAKKVNESLRSSYKAYSLGTKVSTAIFMYSFSGGKERGISLQELKLVCSDINFPSSLIADVVNNLKEKLFYLSDEGLFFTNQPNLNRILTTKAENIDERKIENEQLENLKRIFSEKEKFDVFIWPTNSKDIPDTKKLKLLVLKDKSKMRDFFDYYGKTFRVYKNTLIFLCPEDSEKIVFENYLKKKLAWEMIEQDITLNLTEQQKKIVKEEIRRLKDDFNYELRKLYRKILLPAKDEFKEIDLGLPTLGKDYSIEGEIYQRLKNEGEILEKISPKVIKDNYLKNNDYVETKNIFESFFKIPGNIRIVDEYVLKEGIKEGVKNGMFGIGFLKEGKAECEKFKEDCDVELIEGEIIIKEDLCKKEVPITFPEKEEITEKVVVKEEIKKGEKKEFIETLKSLNLTLSVPHGKLSDFNRVIQFLKGKFNKVILKINLICEEGEISKTEYENKVEESFNQSGITIEEEKSDT